MVLVNRRKKSFYVIGKSLHIKYLKYTDNLVKSMPLKMDRIDTEFFQCIVMYYNGRYIQYKGGTYCQKLNFS